MPISQSKEPEQLLPSSVDRDTSFWDFPAKLCKVSASVDDTGEAREEQPMEVSAPQAENNEVKVSRMSKSEAEIILPYDKRASYIRIARRLRRLRVLPALAACFCALVVTGGVCGSQLVVADTNTSSAAALLGCSLVGCTLAALGARSRSHVVLVGVVLLEVLFTLYAGAFALIGLWNVTLLRRRQVALEQDGKLQQEQRDNALKITGNILIKEALFSGLYFLVAVSHCYAAASANHLRARVRPFDSRLRRKRQRARAFRKLGVNPRQSLDMDDRDGYPGTPDVQLPQSHVLTASGVVYSHTEDCNERTSINRMYSRVLAADVTSFEEHSSNTEAQTGSTLMREPQGSL